MGLFDVFKKKNNENEVATEVVNNIPSTVESSGTEVFLDLNKKSPLVLEKNQFLNLTKTSFSLSKLRAAAGWDVATHGANYDLDLCAFLYNKNNDLLEKVFYGNKRSMGVRLDGDNLTGFGDGDDENIFLNLDNVPSNVSTIAICVVIYEAQSRGQCFKNVKNAYVRLVDENENKEICKYSLTRNGGTNSAVHAVDLIRTDNGWIFKAVEEYINGSVTTVSQTIFR